MAATKEELALWFDEGVRQGASHMVVVCDTFDHSDYPVYVPARPAVGQAVADVVAQYATAPMSRVLEVYDLHLDRDEQLAEERSMHHGFSRPPAGGAEARTSARTSSDE